MKFHEPYKPKLRKNYILAVSSGGLAAAAVCLWIFRERLSVDTGTLFIISGAAVFSVTLSLWQYRKKKENYARSKELSEKQKDIGSDMSNNIFF